MPLFFLALLPPPDISQEIIGFQKEIEKKYAAVHAQKSPPHITIIPPFESSPEKAEQFVHALSESEILNEDLTIHLQGFQHFESRTLFVDVAKNEAFEKCCKRIKLLFNAQKIIKQRTEKHFFVPHITIANKDLKKRDFKQCLEEFKPRTYKRSFLMKNINLLRHNGKKWEIAIIN